MPGKETGLGGHFGRQMRKERLVHGWSLPELARRTGYDAGHLSRVGIGKRPPTEALAAACDAVFTERRGWFTDWYQESRSWSEVPAGFRSWSELEDKAARLCDWMPGTVTGVLPSEDYARAILATFPAVTEETIASRLAARVERQQRVLARENPPKVIFLVDELALYRQVGTAAVMAAQMRHLAATWRPCRRSRCRCCRRSPIPRTPAASRPRRRRRMVRARGRRVRVHRRVKRFRRSLPGSIRSGESATGYRSRSR